MMATLLLITSVLLGAIAQCLLKVAVSTKMPHLFGFSFINVSFCGAVFMYSVSLICYTISLRSIPLPMAFSSISISYVLVAWLSSQIWGTPFGSIEILAFVLIFSGLLLLSASQLGYLNFDSR